MKQKLLSALVVAAVAGMATNANAGVIQASYKNFAAEVFGADVTMTAPTIGYSLALPLTGTAANPNTFTVTYTLTSGKWVAAPTATLVSVNNADFVQAAAGQISADGAKVSYVFTLNNGVTFPTNSTIVLGSNGANGAATDGTINNVYQTLQTPALTANYCAPTPAQIGVSIYMENNAGVQFETNFSAAPLKNDTPILQSNVATKTTVTAGNLLGATVATRESSRVDVLVGSLGKLFTAKEESVAGVPTNDVTDGNALTNRVLNLGSVAFSDRLALYDTDGATIYGVTTGFTNNNTAADGIVSHDGLSIKVSGKFVAGGLLTLNSAANCDAATDLAASGTSTSFNADRTLATITLTGAQLAANSKVYACYTVPGTTVIPTAQFAVTEGTLFRGTTSKELATPVCADKLYNLTANGVRVDVRNYIPAVAEQPSGGWRNIIRVINTDESQPSVDVIGTALLRDGTLGATAVIAAGMKPREVRYLTGASIDAKLTAANNGVTFGDAEVNGDASKGIIGSNARLRITAASSSIRVQNYHFNPVNGNFFEASSAQGDEGPDYQKARDVTNK